jgi:hypothetical protein
VLDHLDDRNIVGHESEIQHVANRIEYAPARLPEERRRFPKIDNLRLRPPIVKFSPENRSRKRSRLLIDHAFF